ncbi:MAG: hypothetical protein A2W91_05245 [Bacteroidetes bacterium GWF2_38_335]|nr:MAG: hypothetical protein A2W91_05245 [Bacteroidetes bacterium GWF2_38_335]OFY79764.1 MAG: hypothetical protein A2281_10175 [Bacteroidetes bacterium RIFOXYA12_FULL_38_20]HBS88152.1 hypothetical protein [Bacteroidales bacterium]
MQETKFIEQNKQKWSDFEKILQDKKKDPDKLSELFIEVTDDLSYSRTFYPNRSVSVYLNNIAQKIFPEIYKSKKISTGRFVTFWKDEVPSMIWYTRKQFILAFSIFVISMLVGIVSSANDPSFPSVILGQDYISMTDRNIEMGDPMAIYKSRNEGDMFLGITYNNLMVAFYTFVMGVLFSVGSAAFLIFNGIMVGTFQYYFLQKGLFVDSFLTIWQHGTIEISCIIIAGAAGITLGQGLVFPGSYSRGQSFQMSARRGIVIMLGIAPLIILAGFIESFITRHTGVPDAVRLTSILLSLLFILFYFVWLPWHKYRSGSLVPVKTAKLQPENLIVPSVNTVQSNGELFIDTFNVFKKNFGKLISVAVLTSIIYVLFIRYYLPEGYTYNFKVSDNNGGLKFLFSSLPYLKNYFLYNDYNSLMWINTTVMFVLTFGVLFYIKKLTESGSYKVKVKFSELVIFALMSILNILPVLVLIALALIKSNILVWILFLFFLPLVSLLFFIVVKERVMIFTTFKKMNGLIAGNFSRVLGLYGVIFLLGFGYFMIVCSPMISFLFDFLMQNITLDPEMFHMAFVLFTTFFIVIGFVLIYAFLMAGAGLLYYTLVEINFSPALMESIRNIGEKKKNGKK